MRKKTVYLYRGYLINNASEIPDSPHYAVIVGGSQDQENKLSYYVFKEKEHDKMQELVNVLYNEDSQRQDIRIVKAMPLQHEVKFVVDIILPETKEESKKINQDVEILKVLEDFQDNIESSKLKEVFEEKKDESGTKDS
jgi:hypothetical protein